MGIVTRVDQRIEDVTGLTMETAEQLQVWTGSVCGHCCCPVTGFSFGAVFPIARLSTTDSVDTTNPILILQE